MAKRNVQSRIKYTHSIKPVMMSDNEWLDAQKAVAALVAQAYWDKRKLVDILEEFLMGTTWSSLPPNVIAPNVPQVVTPPQLGRSSETLDRLLLHALLQLDEKETLNATTMEEERS